MTAGSYAEQIAELVERGVTSAGDQGARRLQAAQALATLELARQQEISNLLSVATLAVKDGAQVALYREALTAAGLQLGLLTDDDDPDMEDARSGGGEAPHG